MKTEDIFRTHAIRTINETSSRINGYDGNLVSKVINNGIEYKLKAAVILKHGSFGDIGLWVMGNSEIVMLPCLEQKYVRNL